MTKAEALKRYKEDIRWIMKRGWIIVMCAGIAVAGLGACVWLEAPSWGTEIFSVYFKSALVGLGWAIARNFRACLTGYGAQLRIATWRGGVRATGFMLGRSLLERKAWASA